MTGARDDQARHTAPDDLLTRRFRLLALSWISRSEPRTQNESSIFRSNDTGERLEVPQTTRHLPSTSQRRKAMTSRLEDLSEISAKTLAHYNVRAAEFWEGTRDHDVKQNIEALLRHMRGALPWHILDFGCGPGVIWRHSAPWGMRRLASTARRNSLPWRVSTAAAQCGSRISSPCSCPPATSTASSPTLRYSMCRARRCRAC
nr:hypothetical protein [Dechloromonas sp. A34]